MLAIDPEMVTSIGLGKIRPSIRIYCGPGPATMSFASSNAALPSESVPGMAIQFASFSQINPVLLSRIVLSPMSVNL
jgi:hypothetical protein